MSFWFIPIPVSFTQNWRYDALFRLNLLTLTLIVPDSVNFREFDSKLMSTCFILFESDTINSSAKLWSQYTWKFSLFSFHWNSNKNLNSSSMSLMANGWRISLNILALNFAKSRMSSTRFRSRHDDISPIFMNLSNLW